MLSSAVQEVQNLDKVNTILAFGLIYIVYYVCKLFVTAEKAPDFPLTNLRWVLEPRIVSNFRYFRDARGILEDGYRRFKSTGFKFDRIDAQMIVLPPRYVNELRNVPTTIASPTVAHVHNLMGSHTNMNIILRNNLHFRTLQEKLTPNLNFVTKHMQDELNYAVELELPKSEEEWVSIKPYHSILDLVSRISARIFLGLPVCRDKRWLEVSTQFTENVFVSLVFLKLFPMWLQPLLSWLVPTTWRGAAYIRQAKRILVPEIKRRMQSPAKPGSVEATNILSWMLEIATQEEKDPAMLAHLEVVLSLASIHTSQMGAVHVLYDLALRPSYIDLMRKEIQSIIDEDGPWMEWKKPSFSKLRKLDSFMKESQRYNPPSLLSYHRVMLQDLHLSDGLKLSKGSHICMAVNAIQNDPDVTPEPDTFDGLRYFKMRQKEGQEHRHQFATTQDDILNFGHGRYACPGRFFASLEIKIILVRLIMDYDFRLKDPGVRPENLKAYEFIFPNPDAELLMKRRPAKDRMDALKPRPRRAVVAEI